MKEEDQVEEMWSLYHNIFAYLNQWSFALSSGDTVIQKQSLTYANKVTNELSQLIQSKL